ncbi:MAG: hypothetical protein FJ386_01420 [Verrucomicrobia bacterium]|nr:hypothetical protein [Verrucomicrobiota bacterium]
MSLINDALKRAGQAQRSQRAPRIPDEGLKPTDGLQPPPRTFFSRPVAPLLRAIVALLLLGGAGLLYYKWSENQLDESEIENKSSGKRSARGQHAARQAGKVAADTNTTTVAAAPVAATPATANPIVAPPVLVTTDPPAKTNEPAPPLVVKAPTNAPPEIAATTTNSPALPTPPTPPTSPAAATLFAPPGTTNPPVVVVPPTVPSVTNTVAVQMPFPRLRVQGIIHRAVNPFALINNRNVTVGDVIDDARIVRIERSSVVFEFHGRVHELWILR